MQSDSAPFFILLLFGLICLLVWLLARHLKEWRRQQQIVGDERASMIGQPVPTDIDRDMARARSGDFGGEELSPLTYLGYRVGKTNGLCPNGRGSVRRLALVLRQFDLTFDVERMGDGQLIAILPREFDRWQEQAAG